jgi:tetratricopeptide (TPR) repeat protein
MRIRPLARQAAVFFACATMSVWGYAGVAAAEETEQVEIPIKSTSQAVACPTDSEQARVFYNRAIELTAEGKLEEAKVLYQEAIAQDEQFCDAMDNLGHLLRSQGELEKAIEWYQRSLGASPANGTAYQNLGVVYQMRGNYQQAEFAYRRLKAIEPENPEGYYGLGLVYLNTEQPEQAIEPLQAAITLYQENDSPWIVDARYYLGMAYYKQQRWQQARDAFELVYQQLGDDPQLNFYLGMCYHKSETINDPEMAQQYFRKAKELGWDVPEKLLDGN